MADEIRINERLQVINEEYKATFQPTTLLVDQAVQGANSGILTVGTSQEDLGVVDIATLGWLILHNLDDTNYVTFGPKSGTMVAFGKLKAGEHCRVRLSPGITLTLVADTAPVKVYYLLLND